MRLDDVADDGQAEAAALLLAVEAVVDAVEALEDAAVLAARDAGAVVGDRQLDVAVVGATAQVDAAVVAAVLGGVLEQVEQRLAEHGAVGEDRRQVARHVGGEGDVLLQADRLEGAQRRVDHAAHPLGLAVVDHRPRLHAAEVEQAADHHAEPLGLVIEHLEALAALLVGERARLEQGLGEEPDAGQRRLELVRDLGEEVELQLRQVGGALERERQPDGADQRRHAEGEDEDAEGDVDRGALEDQHQDADDRQRRHRQQHEGGGQPHVAPETHAGMVAPRSGAVKAGRRHRRGVAARR